MTLSTLYRGKYGVLRNFFLSSAVVTVTGIEFMISFLTRVLQLPTWFKVRLMLGFESSGSIQHMPALKTRFPF